MNNYAENIKSLNEALDSSLQTSNALANRLKYAKGLLLECQRVISMKHESYEEEALVKEIDEFVNN